MFTKCVAIAAAALISAGATAKPVKSHATTSVAGHSVSARSVALENVIGRVQLDALIDEIVSSDNVKPAVLRNVAYAAIASTKSRNRS